MKQEVSHHRHQICQPPKPELQKQIPVVLKLLSLWFVLMATQKD
jgi:hypothetical protein